MNKRQAKKKIPKGRYCYEWVDYRTGEVKLCPFFKFINKLQDIPLEYQEAYKNEDDTLADWCRLTKQFTLDQIKSCNHKLEY